jgi:hemolysin III
VGSIVYVVEKPDFYPGVFGFHEVWHVFVILGCLSHFILVATYVAPHAVGV